MTEPEQGNVFREIVRLSELHSIRALQMGADATSAIGLNQSEVTADLKDRARWTLDPDRRALGVEVDFSLVIRSVDDENCRFTAEITYALEYTFDEPLPEDEVTEGALDLFARNNPRFNAWPFLREYINYATSYAELPSMVLPLLKPNAALRQPALEANVSDHSEQAVN